MSSPIIHDCFSIFPAFWESVQHLPINHQIERWDNIYMQKWPILRNKLKKSYKEDGYDWFEIAKEHVFPKISKYFRDYMNIGTILMENIPSVYTTMKQRFKFDFDIEFVIYVGIGLGAGWGTKYRGKPAVLFGIENAAEMNWNTRRVLRPLIAHEVGHLIHQNWRTANGLDAWGESPLWTLYDEGLAMRIEHLTMGYESWHEQQEEKGWRVWCQTHIKWLANHFLDQLAEDSPEALRPFFGSWYDIQGYKQTGYYLGHEMIRQLEKQFSIQEIATFTDAEVSQKMNEMLLLFAQ